MPAERIVVDGLGRLPQFAHAAWAGDTLFVSGTLGTTEGLTLAEGMAAQTTQTLRNMARILEAAGVGWDDVAKVSVFVDDMTAFGEMNEAYSAFFGDGTPPARITVGGCRLALGAHVEMECIAGRSSANAAPSTAALPSRRAVRLDHDGDTIFAEVTGEEHRDAGPPIVFSHGAGGSHAIWWQQVAHFARSRMVVTWDHRGFGNSTDHGDRTGPDVAVGDLLALLDHLGIERAVLVGQSMGGWTTIGAALERPALCERIVLADTLGGFRSDAIDAAMAAASPPQPPDGRPIGSVLGVHPAIDPSLAERDPARAHLYQLLGGFGTVDMDVLIPRLLGWSHPAEAALRITCPVLCVVGERDPLFPPSSVRAVADLLPDARVSEIAGCGHSPYFEDPDTWNAVVSAFV